MHKIPETIGHFINGKYVSEGVIAERRDPADRYETVAQYHNGNNEVLDAALRAAENAFPAWAKKTRRDRAEIVFRAAQLLDAPEWRARLSEGMIAEIGKTAAGARGETEKTVRILRHMASLGTMTPDQLIHPDQSGAIMYTVSVPVGVAGLVTPFNFPAAVPAWKIAPALVAGATVVMKPSPAAPITSWNLAELFREAGVPDGVLNVVHGGADMARGLANDPRVQAFSFTGSTAAGTDLLQIAMQRDPPLDPGHFLAEMGGQNALVIMEDADLDQAAEAAVNGAMKGEGQRCTATSRLVVARSIYQDFMEKVLARIANLKIGPGKDPGNDMGPLVSEEAVLKAIEAVQGAVRNGMELICGGERLTAGDLARGNFMQPTLLKGDPANRAHIALHDEIFGPVAGVCVVENLEEAIAVTNGVDHRHAASIFTRDLRAAAQFVERANVGMVHVNNPTIGGDAQAPFGGLGGATSYGPKEMGTDAMDIFLRRKTVDINPGGPSLAAGAR